MLLTIQMHMIIFNRLFRIENNENIICRLSSQNFENFEFFLQKPYFRPVLVYEIENKNSDLT